MSSLSALNLPHDSTSPDQGTPGFTGYSKFCSAYIFCARSSLRNSSSLMAFSFRAECLVTPAPLMFM